MLIQDVTNLLLDQDRAGTAIALGAAIGVDLQVVRKRQTSTILGVVTPAGDLTIIRAMLVIPTLTLAPVTRVTEGYEDEFEYVEDAVRSFCAMC